MTAMELIRRPLAAALLGAAAVALPASALYFYNQAPHAAETRNPRTGTRQRVFVFIRHTPPATAVSMRTPKPLS